MPRLTKSQPKYRKHRASGQAVVELDGRDFYLGPYGTTTSHAEYDRLVGEWMANGRRLQGEKGRRDITVAELLTAYWDHAEAYYRNPDGSEAGELDNQRQAFRPLDRLYGHTPAADFGPLSLKALQQAMVKLGWCRSYLNKQLSRVKMLFKWGVSQELVPPSVFHGLQAVAGLRRGRSDARESDPVKPVPEEYIGAILPLVAPPVKAMIELQLLTGMRPGEVCCMRGVDLDTSGAIWIYKPAHHKTEHHGFSREIWIGPKAKAILQPFLKPDLAAYLFSPKEAEASRYAEAKTHRRPDQKPNPRKSHRQLGDRYDVNAYRRAIARGCDAAFAPPPSLPRLRVASEKGEGATRWETKAEWKARLGVEKWAELRKWLSEHRWHPHQLRHNAATRLRREYGIEAARVILGHHSLEVTEIYAEKDVAKAKQIMAEVG